MVIMTIFLHMSHKDAQKYQLIITLLFPRRSWIMPTATVRSSFLWARCVPWSSTITNVLRWNVFYSTISTSLHLLPYILLNFSPLSHTKNFSSSLNKTLNTTDFLQIFYHQWRQKPRTPKIPRNKQTFHLFTRS